MARGLPSGTVTFLFTDIEGSSRLWEVDRESMRVALARHDALLREAVTSRGGVVFSTGGDGVAAAFGRARDAVEAAVEVQVAFAAEAWPTPEPLRVRMGLHTGEAEERDGDYFGPAVNRAARLMGIANGAQVLVSLATAEIVRPVLSEGVALVDRGEHELRSIRRAEHVYQVFWPGSTPTPVAAPTVVHGNLPTRRGALIGREVELASVLRALTESQLVTLSGVGGVGKTSMALAAAAAVAGSFADGVWFFELAAVLDGKEVAQAMAETMGLRPQSGLSQRQLLVGALAHQSCVVVLDNCEHVLDAAAEVVEDLVRRCSGVKVLATSREALGLPDERIVSVRPLEPAHAVALFETRVAAQEGGFSLADADRGLVGEVCERLDGLPLAVELAAARVRSMPLADLAARLGERFRLLRGQRRATERHQTLRATVAWSYDLLGEREQRVFDRLSVFTGGFTLSAAETVCAGDELDTWDITEAVGALADKSMAVSGLAGRYLMFETLRQFGDERLEARGDPDRFRRAHAAYFADLVVAAHDGLQGPDEASWWQRLNADWANIRAASAWAVAARDLDTASTIAVHLIWAATWHDTAEPFLWIETVAAMSGVEAHPRRASILAGQAFAAWERDDLRAAVTLGRAAIAAERPGQPNIDYIAECAIMSGAIFARDLALAQQYLDRIVQRAHEDGRTVLEATYRTSHAIYLLSRGEPEAALAAAQAALDIAEATGNPNAISWALAQQAAALADLGDSSRPRATAERSLILADSVGAVVPTLVSRRTLARILLDTGRRAEAALLVLGTLEAIRRGKHAGMWVRQTLIHAARLLAAGPTTETAAVLYGAIRTSTAATGPTTATVLEDARRLLDAKLEGEVFQHLVKNGEGLSLERAAVLAEVALRQLIETHEDS